LKKERVREVFIARTTKPLNKLKNPRTKSSSKNKILHLKAPIKNRSIMNQLLGKMSLRVIKVSAMFMSLASPNALLRILYAKYSVSLGQLKT